MKFDWDQDDLNDGEAKAILNKIHSMLMPDVELEGPSIPASTYPGEKGSGSVSPAVFGEV